MKTDWKMVLLIVGIMIVISTPIAVVLIIYNKELGFSPSGFINEYVKFVIVIAAMLISFWMSEVYWKRKNMRDQINRYRKQFLYYLDNIGQIIVQTDKLYDIEVHVGNGKERNRIDTEIMANLRRLGDAEKITTKFLDDSKLEFKEEDRVVKAISYFRTVVKPRLVKLSTRGAIGDRSQLKAELVELADLLDVIVKYLKGKINELDSTG